MRKKKKKKKKNANAVFGSTLNRRYKELRAFRGVMLFRILICGSLAQWYRGLFISQRLKKLKTSDPDRFSCSFFFRFLFFISAVKWPNHTHEFSWVLHVIYSTSQTWQSILFLFTLSMSGSHFQFFALFQKVVEMDE